MSAKRSGVMKAGGTTMILRSGVNRQRWIGTVKGRLQQIPDHTVHPILLHWKSTVIACTTGVCRVFPDLLQTKRSKMMI